MPTETPDANVASLNVQTTLAADDTRINAQRTRDDAGGPRFTHGALPDLAPLLEPGAGDEKSGRLVRSPLPGGALFGSRFGRILPENPRSPSEDALKTLALAMSADDEAHPTPETDADDEENTDIDAGYTYIGQFVDHDLTFDPVAAFTSARPTDTTNFRTPRFDLDNLYGAGPKDQPYMYDPKGMYLVLGGKLDTSVDAVDLPRAASGRAIIGDPRNDENRIVAQLHATMMQFHNKAVDRLLAMPANQALSADEIFARAQDQVRWHYQYMVVNDFLKTIIDAEIVDDVLTHGNKLFKLAGRAPFIPIEFSAAAYRFGHSMVRPSYRLNKARDRQPIFPGLVGFSPINPLDAIDWRFFFSLDPALDPTTSASPNGSRQQKTSGRPPMPLQKAYKIDTSIVFPMITLPPQVTSAPFSIAERNLLRSRQFSIASTQLAISAMGHLGIHFPGVDPSGLLKDLRVGKANESYPELPPLLQAIGEALKETAGAPPSARAKSIAGEIAQSTPLWYFALLEAQQGFVKRLDGDVVQNVGAPIRLRGVGGRIVAETFIALLRADPTSYLGHSAPWTPENGIFGATKEFGIKDLIKIARPTYATP